MYRRVLTIACAMLCVELGVYASQGVKISVQLVSFSNPKSLDRNNKCCDPGCLRCNYFFKLCLKDWSSKACVLSVQTKTWDNTNYIVFNRGPGKLGNSNDNPLVKELSSWKGRLLVSIDVMDYDTWSWADLVDKYVIDKHVTPTAGVLQPSWTDITIKGIPSTMVLRYSVQCNRDYYGPNCTKYCMARDNNQGHYTCSLQTGGKACRAGWYGTDCLTHCTPRDDDVNGHYTCQPNTGAKMCRVGWFGGRCQTFCLPRNDSQAGFTCDANGQRGCLDDWYPIKHCEVFCVPRNDSTAGHTCDMTTGYKTCLTGWSGPECDCKPRNDSTAGFNCNTTTGERSCHLGWFGSHCNIYCTPRDDSIGHYGCNVKTGAKECLANWFGQYCDIYCAPRNHTTGQTRCSVNNTQICARNWYGANCSVHCEPRDDDEAHYTCHQGTGEKICAPGWYGANCSTQCTPRNNDWFGHFDCNKDGTKKCYLFWYGNDCKVYCRHQNSSSHGFYRCRQSDGAQVCLEDWYGPKCLTFCQGRDDDSGHFRCDNIDGRATCLENWYGLNCTVNCVPRDDHNAHFTCDRLTGQEICMDGWTGSNCGEMMPTKAGETTSTLPTLPANQESQKDNSEKELSELSMALILGGFLLLICITVATTIVICSCRQTKKFAKPFPYKRYHTSGNAKSLEEPRVSNDSAEPTPDSQAKRESRIPNLLSKYDDDACRDKDVCINLQEVSWNHDGSRKVDEKLVMFNNPLFMARKSISEESRTGPRVDSRVDPFTGLRDNSDWVAIFESYNDLDY